MVLLKTENLFIERIDSRLPDKEPVYILENVNISIEENKITSLSGASGAGKSIFAKTISGLLPHNLAITKGTIFYEEKPVDYTYLKKIRGKEIFYTPQNATASLNPVYKIKRQLLETPGTNLPQLTGILENLNFPANEINRILNSYPFELSGGENQRCLLAMAIAQKPRLLILDEPTSALDALSQKLFMDLLEKTKQYYNLTVLLITHTLNASGNQGAFLKNRPLDP